ncbi:hypothetical protein N836_31450 [Leptolyngbya sp. Heron Island J]|uniref:hypothetical protein n=1 Tax=Leptolyngbya sp. Heron Island J TaxID=1385935 RepID=UPI0003B99603|nr:hypothetical protein [Leptolyngbya sp. Heron Island J]ESA38458.1 hypothetical protein N836_31450 [Leptolyngbya sp. Heron Island J]
MRTTEDLKKAKATAGQGFSTDRTQSQASHQVQAPSTAPSESAEQAKEASLAFSDTAAAALGHQLQKKVDVITGLERKLESAADAIAYREECMLNGSTLESMLAKRRSTYQLGESVQADATVSIEFERLEGGDLLTNLSAPKFPDPKTFANLLSPAQKARLDQAVLGPAK